MIAKNIALTILLSLSHFLTQAQKLVSEGTINYKVTISGKVPTPANEPAITESKSGTVSIKIKGDNIRQDIQLEDGYKHSQISNFTTGKEIILQSVNGLKYAIEINIKDKEKQNSQYYDAAIALNKDIKSFAGYDAKSATATYKNGTTLALFVLQDYYLNYPQIFDRFPDLKGIPASYDLLMGNGFTTHFELTTLNEDPIQNALFRIPEGYRIISQKEYEKLLK
jgi:hypothetical protein